jgi:hypothetical protein
MARERVLSPITPFVLTPPILPWELYAPRDRVGRSFCIVPSPLTATLPLHCGRMGTLIGTTRNSLCRPNHEFSASYLQQRHQLQLFFSPKPQWVPAPPVKSAGGARLLLLKNETATSRSQARRLIRPMNSTLLMLCLRE